MLARVVRKRYLRLIPDGGVKGLREIFFRIKLHFKDLAVCMEQCFHPTPALVPHHTISTSSPNRRRWTIGTVPSLPFGTTNNPVKICYDRIQP